MKDESNDVLSPLQGILSAVLLRTTQGTGKTKLIITSPEHCC